MMSPYNFVWSSSNYNLRVFEVDGSANPGRLRYYADLNTGVGVRPVISLKYR